jgi:hypothetical protein
MLHAPNDDAGGDAEALRKGFHVGVGFQPRQFAGAVGRDQDRERWFKVVMGERFKVDGRSTEKLARRVPFPASITDGLAIRLAVPQPCLVPDVQDCHRVLVTGNAGAD